MEPKKDYFSSRRAFLFAAIGMAIGAGNIWRFPRLAGQYGGSFLIPWIIFLFLWSIPLIVIEFSLGKKIRRSVIGVFSSQLGKSYTWMGWFITVCTIGIMFYYSVVCGWSLKYFILGLTNQLHQMDHAGFWTEYTTGNWDPVLYQIISVIVGASIIFFGVNRGIERASRLLIPLLFVLMVVAAIRSLTLPNASQGLHYFFRINPDDLLDYRIWLEGLSQSAWSTGAGWGLVLTYSTYVKSEEKAFTNALFTGLGNNLASILAGLAIIPAVFALSPSIQDANSALAAGNQGLTFIFLPQLFEKMPAGPLVNALFFFALFIAAISSFIAMLELGVRSLMDYGLSRPISVILIAGLTILLGFPSAFSLNFFNNQDWVWGVGLLLSGLFFIVFVIKTGLHQFLKNYLSGEHIFLTKYFHLHYFLIGVMLVEFFLMFLWWFFQSLNWYPDT